MNRPIRDPLLEKVAEQAQKWADNLIDLGSRNTLLYYRNTKLGTLDLTEAPPQAISTLLSRQKTRLSLLFPEADNHKDACVRARNLRRKVVELEEEQGIDAGRLALGLLRVTPPATRGTSPVPALRAPLLLLPLAIRSRTVSENDFTLEVDGEPEVNPVLLYALSRQYGVETEADDLAEKINAAVEECADPADRPRAAYRILADKLASARLAVEFEERAVAGVFSFDRLPMVNDLRTSTKLLARHPVIAALAGDEYAATALRENAAGFAPMGADAIEPQAEFLVLDADASQQRAISAVAAGHHIVIEGPPGTGKSQTIANIIATLAAEGKRILFVAEKRAAIEAVTDRLAQVELEGLVFDLHKSKLNRRQIAQQLQAALERSGSETAPIRDGLHESLAQYRSQARLHVDEFHRPHEPWHASAYEAMAHLAAFSQELQTRIRIRGSQLARLHGPELADVREALHQYVAYRGLAIRRGESPWAKTTARTKEHISGAIAGLDHLTGRAMLDTRQEIEQLVQEAGLRPAENISQWQVVLTLLRDVSQSVAEFSVDVFQPGLDDLVSATATSAWRKANNRPMGWWQRRSLVKRARLLRQDGQRDRRALHAALAKAEAQSRMWQIHSVQDSSPCAVPQLGEAMDHFAQLRDQLTAVAMCARIDGLELKPADEFDEQIRRLDDDRATLMNMPMLNVLRERLEAAGLRPLLDEIAAAGDPNPASAVERFDFVWWSSLHDEIISESAHVRSFTSRQHEHYIEGFQKNDRLHLAQNAKRIRYRVATALRKTRDANPEQNALVRDQANRKYRHLSLRKLVEKAPDVLLAAKPCWAMSPLVVSRVLPAERLFDVVVFDEASQIPPHDAITSIMRAAQVVVAGDPHQLPPTAFFTRMASGITDGDDEDDVTDPGAFESLLDMLSGSLPTQCNQRLRWHYRSSDERLIAFSNKKIYDNDLVTFPGTATESPVRLEVVDGRVAPGRKGSAPEEVERVVELIIDHADKHPELSLGVIAMGQTHADRIQAVLQKSLTDRPDLESFFSPDLGAGRRFFIKNLERVQGDERDAIILSIGYAKAANGVLPLRFGPLNLEGGERRLNVAITRARRAMTVVASFSHEDFDPNTLEASRNPGPKMLRDFLEYCAHRGNLERVEGRRTAFELNAFEQQVHDSLAGHGITVVPQWGVSDYRIDFALGHPDRPGQMVLAVETDGDSYHHAVSVRERDRLRQAHLENLGWRFHRIWAAEWFRDQAAETARAVEAWRVAVRTADQLRNRPLPKPSPNNEAAGPARPAVSTTPVSRGRRPNVTPGLRISEYMPLELRQLARWLLSDGLQVDRETRIGQAMEDLGFTRRGKNIVDALNRAFEEAQREADKEQR